MIPNNFFGCGSTYYSYTGNGDGSINSIDGNGVGYDILVAISNGNGDGCGVRCVFTPDNGNGHGGGGTVIQIGDGYGRGEMPYIIGKGNPTDLKSIVMWAVLIGERR